MTPAERVAEYRPLAAWVARDYFLPGADRQDVEQEALIALWLAAKAFDPEVSLPFEPFARLVIRRRLATAVDLAHAQRHRHLNESIRELVSEDGERLIPFEVLPGGRDPVEILIDRERIARLVEARKALTPVEREGLRLAMNGVPYDREATGDKRLDNAVQRARRKLREAA